ncbi:MAG: class I SAM-dependent methyltransferase [bacterium]
MHNQGQRDYFEGLLAKHGNSYLALDWNSPESQKLRYIILSQILQFSAKSVDLSLLDVGCGFGDLFDFLRSQKLLASHNISYLGYDISDKILAVAKKNYPDAKFEHKDLLLETDVPHVDFIFASGIFNIRVLPKDEHHNFVKEMLQRMYELANYGVAVNFLSENGVSISDIDDLNSGRYFCFKVEDLAEFSRALTNRFIIRHDYHQGDFTLYLLK